MTKLLVSSKLLVTRTNTSQTNHDCCTSYVNEIFPVIFRVIIWKFPQLLSIFLRRLARLTETRRYNPARNPTPRRSYPLQRQEINFSLITARWGDPSVLDAYNGFFFSRSAKSRTGSIIHSAKRTRPSAFLLSRIWLKRPRYIKETTLYSSAKLQRRAVMREQRAVLSSSYDMMTAKWARASA